MKIIRMSGEPVLLELKDAYKAEFQARFDIIEAEHKLDMLMFHQALIDLDAELKPKYSLIEERPMPKSARQWQKLVFEFEAPIMVANSAENKKELLLIIMDAPA